MLKYIISSILLVSTAHYFYIDIPEGWDSPWEVRARLGALRFTFQLGSLVEDLGIASAISVRKGVSDVLKPVLTLGVRTAHLQHVANATDTMFAGVHVRVFQPTWSSDEVLKPGLVYFHGGGWAMGDIDLYDSHVRRIVRDTGVVAVSVEYRLAPQNPYPAALDDCVNVTKHFLTYAHQYGVDSSRVVVMGDSAGGNLAAATAMVLRDQRFTPALKMQVLIYPVLQLLNFNSPSYLYSYISENFLPSREAMIYYYLYYAFGHIDFYEDFINTLHCPRETMDSLLESHMPLDILPHDRAFEAFTEKRQPEHSLLWEKVKDRILDPYLCPLMADDLTDLPHAYISVAQNDVIRDEGLWYGHRLKQFGVPVEMDLFQIGFHSWQIFSEDLTQSDQNLAKLTQYVNQHL